MYTEKVLENRLALPIIRMIQIILIIKTKRSRSIK